MTQLTLLYIIKCVYFIGGRQVVYVAGGTRGSTTAVQLLDYTQTEAWETSKCIIEFKTKKAPIFTK